MQSRLVMNFDKSKRNETQIKIYSFKYYNKYHSLYIFTHYMHGTFKFLINA